MSISSQLHHTWQLMGCHHLRCCPRPAPCAYFFPWTACCARTPTCSSDDHQAIGNQMFSSKCTHVLPCQRWAFERAAHILLFLEGDQCMSSGLRQSPLAANSSTGILKFSCPQMHVVCL